MGTATRAVNLSSEHCPTLQELLNSNMQQNLQLVVQVAKEYTEQLGADKIIELLEGVKSYHGLYYYLGSYLAFSEDPEVSPMTLPLITMPVMNHSSSHPKAPHVSAAIEQLRRA